MRKFFLLFIYLHISHLAIAQFIDDFSDGDFLNNPTWQGNINLFEVDSNFTLHLKDSTSNTSYLSTTNNAIINGIWKFEVALDFSPSTSNYARIYLVSDKQNLTENLNGYYVKIGGESGSADGVSLYSQQGNNHNEIINGSDAIAAINPNLKIKVTRDSAGNWDLYADTSNGYFFEGSAFDDNITSTEFFGIFCKYTSTRADKFWFDNFSVSGSPDTTTPQQINQNEIVINEIFVDPTPSIGLPEIEYIELYNLTNKPVSLSDWTIEVGGSKKIIPETILPADSFAILVKENAIDSFPNNIVKIGLSSLSLANSGSDIVLKDNTGKTINAISYTDKWYNDNNKNEGGWSIEKVNANLFCEGKNNWRASIANIGGTPGKQNSVTEKNIFISDFRITKANIIDSNRVKVNFNKSLDSLLLGDNSFFQINGNITIKSNPSSPFFNSTILTSNHNFLKGETYSISASNLFDCTGNMVSNTLYFGLPDSALENDIILNEILFNPKEDGVDYIVLYKNSNSFFDLSRLNIANYFVFGNQISPTNPKIITSSPTLFSPKTYLVITTDSSKIKSQYYCANPYNFIEVVSLPSLANDTGTICIVHQSLNQIIDAFSYSENMHFSLLDDNDGVSLERLDANAKTQDINNWHSAASTVGFGTPTYKNSQYKITHSLGEINIEPKSFSPNNDGNKDICTINWKFNQNNLMATITIFDDKGKAVNQLLQNEMIGNSGNIIWDGTSSFNNQLNTGIYVVFMEVFSEEGYTDSFKKVVVLSR